MRLIEFTQQLLNQFESLTYQGISLSKEIAKSYDYHSDHSRNLYDLSMYDHIRTGLQAGISLIEYLKLHQYEVDQEEMQLAFIAFVLHDLHKSESIRKHQSSEYGLTLEQIEEVGQQLCKDLSIAPPPAPFLRLAGVSNFSNKQGDFSFLPDGHHWSHIRHWVKLLDKVASITSIAECLSYPSINKLEQQLRQVLPPTFHQLHIHFHYVQEVRGIITTLIHNGMANLMDQQGYLPWLCFGDGTLYLSLESRIVKPKESLYQSLFDMLIHSVEESSEEIPENKLFDNTIFECQLLSYMIYSRPEDFATLFYRQFSNLRSQSTFPENKFTSKRLSEYKVKTFEELLQKLGVYGELDDDIRDKWMFTSYYFAALQRLTRRMLQISLLDALEKLARYFELPYEDLWLYEPVKQNNNKKYDGAIWLAFRFMEAQSKKQPISQIPIADYRLLIRNESISYLQEIVKRDICKQILGEELPIEQDFTQYLHEQLVLSWDRSRKINPLEMNEVFKKKNRSQKKICNLCNRSIVSSGGKVRAKVIEDAVNVFSNRVLPKENKVDVLHWCTICEFEFILRQVFNINLLGDKSKTQRVYLYAIPSYQFTSERLSEIKDDFEYLFGAIYVHAEKGPIQDAWQTPFVSQDPSILREHFRQHFEKCSDYYQREGHAKATGDVLRAGPVGNIIMLTYDCYSTSEERTREEAWMKALSAALSIHQLYGFRVLLTEKPFLFISDIREIPYAVNLDAPPLAVGRLAKNQNAVPIEVIEKTIFQLASLWEVYRCIYPFDYSKRTDKAISSVIHELFAKPLPGSYFFKRWMTTYSFLPNPSFTYACQQLNEMKGGSDMSLIKDITEASVALYQPRNTPDGRAHRFENLFRLVVKGIKEGADKSALCGLIMKRLERLVGQKDGFVVLPINSEAIARFVDLVYDELFLGFCGGKLAKLVQKQNSFADGVFFETYQLIRKQKEESLT